VPPSVVSNVEPPQATSAAREKVESVNAWRRKEGMSMVQ
jgi:hypothetical protein